MIQSHKIDKLRRIFIISRRDIFNHHICNILHLAAIIPDFVKQLHILNGKRCFHSICHVIAIITSLTSYINRSETIHRHICNLFLQRVNCHKTSHVFACDIWFESSFTSDPIRTFFRNRFLSHFISQLNLKFSSVQTSLAAHSRDIELSLFFRSFLSCKRRWCKDEPELLHTF